MRVLSCVFILLYLSLIGPYTYGQSPDVNWFFGASRAGMRFDTSNNTIDANNVKGEMFGREGCVTVSNPRSGDLLFYTDGNYIYDSEHRLVTSDLGGHTSTAQAASVCTFPCNPNKYYLFSSNAYLEAAEIFPGVLQYAIVEINQDSVIVQPQNRNLVLDDSVSEVKTIVPHPSGNAYWLLGFKNRSSTMYVYKIDCKGISNVTLYDFENGGYQSVFYPTVLKYHTATRTLALTSLIGGLATFKFDPVSGIPSDYNKIEAYDDIRAYDVEWSSDGSKLYVSKFSTATLVQYDFITNETTPLYFSLAKGGGLQTGPDGFIYHIPDGIDGQFLNRIEKPNEAGVACNYIEDVYDVGLIINGFKFPEPLVNKAQVGCVTMVKSFDRSAVCSGQTTRVLIEIENNSCDTITDVYFSDDLKPFGTILNTDRINNGDILINTGESFSIISIENIKLLPGITSFEFDVSFTIDRNDTLYNQAILLIPEFPEDTIFSDDPSNELKDDSTEIVIDNNPKYDFFTSDTTLCDGEILMLTVGKNFDNIEWQDGSQDTFFVVQDSGLYYVETSDACGVFRDTTEVFYENCNCAIFMPTAFSPNGDNLNELLEVKIFNGHDYHLAIYNRWGEKIFESFDVSHHWDGTFEGKRLSTDVFGYALKFICNQDGLIFEKNGNITLMR